MFAWIRLMVLFFVSFATAMAGTEGTFKELVATQGGGESVVAHTAL